VENKTEKSIKTLRSDNGGEYINKRFEAYLKAHGIHHQRTTPYTPQQNGVAERANRTIVERARSMIHDRELEYEYWGEAVATTVYLKNRSPTRALDGMTPEEAWTAENRSKLEPKAIACTFVGYDGNSKAYRLYDPVKRKIIKSRDVTFDEGEMNSPSNVQPLIDDIQFTPNPTIIVNSDDDRTDDEAPELINDVDDMIVVETHHPRRSTRESRPPSTNPSCEIRPGKSLTSHRDARQSGRNGCSS